MSYIAQTALELGFQYALVAMALFLSYRVLDIADLTTNDCFVLGCTASMTLTAAGRPFLAIPATMLVGTCTGFVTAFLQTKLGVPSILVGIVTDTGLYTVNLMAMGWRASQSLLEQDTVFTLFRATGIGGDWNPVLLSGGVTMLASVLLVAFLGTRLSLSIRVTGDNRDIVHSSFISPNFIIAIGLCVANAFTGLFDAVVGQAWKTVDINSGTGIVVIGLVCLIIGETIVGRSAIFQEAITVVTSSIFYRLVYALVLYIKVVSVDCLKPVTALVMALTIAAPSIRQWQAFQTRKRRALAERKGEK